MPETGPALHLNLVRHRMQWECQQGDQLGLPRECEAGRRWHRSLSRSSSTVLMKLLGHQKMGTIMSIATSFMKLVARKAARPRPMQLGHPWRHVLLLLLT